jgi:hydroxyethylthiazole kinase-like uncharacterized protein yjeF
MSLSQIPFAKHNCHQVYDAQQVLTNEGLIAQSQKVPMYQLMEWAGKAAFEQLSQHWPKAKVILLLCGKGNNGGDGFIIARLAHLAGIKVSVLLTCQPSEIKGDANIAYQAMISAGVKQVFTENILEHIRRFQGQVIVDALFGIGFYGVLAEPGQQWVEAINENKTPVLSVDTPSGLCASTGYVNEKNAVIADITVTFIVYKQGLLTGQAANFVGKIILAELTLGTAFKQQVASKHLYQSLSMLINDTSPLKKRWRTSHKGSIGQILAIGGNVGMPGAIRLASEGALRSGAALVSVCCHDDNQNLVFNGRPELMLAPSNAKELAQSKAMEKASVILLGPGLGQQTWSQQLFDLVIEQSKQRKFQKLMVIDADALTLLARIPRYYKHWILTPHPKEAAILLGCSVKDVEADRFKAVRAIVKKYGGICVLKGAGSLICDGEQVVINSTGNAGMASGGMGDVLSGIVAAFILQAEHYFAAVCLAVYIHGAAGDIIASTYGQRGMLASDLFTPIQQLTNQA